MGLIVRGEYSKRGKLVCKNPGAKNLNKLHKPTLHFCLVDRMSVVLCINITCSKKTIIAQNGFFIVKRCIWPSKLRVYIILLSVEGYINRRKKTVYFTITAFCTFTYSTCLEILVE